MNRALAEWRFQALVVTLMAFFAVAPFFDEPIFFDLIGAALLIVATFAVSRNRTVLLVSVVLAAGSFVGLSVAGAVANPALRAAAHLANVGFFVVIVGSILSYVFRTRQVGITRETVAAAVCAYLLVAGVFSGLYATLETLDPGSFSGPILLGDTGRTPRQLLSDFNYFSLVTLSTLGYGDIAPVTRPARSLASLEAVFGQLYLGVLIAQLIGQQIRSEEKGG